MLNICQTLTTLKVQRWYSLYTHAEILKQIKHYIEVIKGFMVWWYYNMQAYSWLRTCMHSYLLIIRYCPVLCATWLAFALLSVCSTVHKNESAANSLNYTWKFHCYKSLFSYFIFKVVINIDDFIFRWYWVLYVIEVMWSSVKSWYQWRLFKLSPVCTT